MRQSHALMIALLVICLALAACAEQGSAPAAIEKYLKAKIAGDEDRLVGLACKAWEAQAMLDAASFRSVKAELHNMSCKENGKEADFTLVTCQGTLIVQYRGENPREQSLSGITYRAIKEDGEWKMCGEQ